ncbi:MAG: TolC family protein [Cyclobacteriaceae bacterium]
MKVLIGALVLLFFTWSAHAQEASVQTLTLDECVDIALENNLNIKRGELNLEDQEITLKQNRFNQLPNLNVGGNYGYNWGRSIDPTTNLFISQRIGFTGLSGNTNWVLFNGMQVRKSIEQSQVDLQARTYDLERAKNDAILAVVDAYLTVIFNEEQLENARFQIQSTNEQLIRTTKLVNAGSLPITNKLNLESQLATDELNLVQNENNLALSLLNLKQLLLLPVETQIDVYKPEIAMDLELSLSEKASEIYSTAEQLMPEIKSADLTIRSADLGYRIAQGGRYPSLSVNGQFSTNYSSAANRERRVFDGTETVLLQTGFLTDDPGTTVSSFVEQPRVVEVRPDFQLGDQFSDNFSRSLSLNLSIPVFNRWQTEAGVQRSKINQQRAQITAQETRNQLRQNIETAYNDALAASKSYSASTKQVEALQESFRITQNQYDLGAVNFTDFQVANNNLVQAKSDLIRAKYQYLFRLKILDFYQGKPLTIE